MNKEINIHGERHIINEAFLHCIKRAKRYKWSLKKWSAKDALKTKDGKILQFYDGRDYDKNKWTLVKNAWDHEHCMICHWHICNEQHQDKGTEGYFNGKEWLCQECYNEFVRKNQNNNKNEEKTG